MKILVLGGTVFLGRQVVEEALTRGHEVTLFHRGQHGRELFPTVRRVLGDRDGELSRLGEATFDAVIDTSGYVPRLVRDSASFLSERVGHYIFVSTISVYRDFDGDPILESHPLAGLPAGVQAEETMSGDTYGPLKALCEQAVRANFAGLSTVVRPGLIVGPHDPTDRFTYWVDRLARGGMVAVPGPHTRPIQFIDVRDLAAFLVHLAESRVSGTFNATGPSHALDMGTLVGVMRQAAQSAEVIWLPEDYLLSQGISSWIEMPLWVPDSPESRGLFRVSVEQALHHGLTLRPVPDTVATTLRWHRERGAVALRAGLDPHKERALLAGWQEAHSS